MNIGDNSNVTINYGSNSQLNVNQAIHQNQSKIDALFKQAREAIDVQDEAQRQAAKDALADLDDEVKAKEPKPSRLKSFAATAIKACSKSPPFIKSVLEICKLCGVEPSSMIHHVGADLEHLLK